MNKYIPKVGEKFEWRSDSCGIWQKAGACIAHSTKAVGYETPNGWITSVDKEFQFRPIPTKSDVEREQLLSLMSQSGFLADRASVIQQAGFTIPKKVKRSEISMIISRNSNYCKNPMFPSMLSGICELLGDLVEQDGGGAE
jgi:hypothetical protein